MLRRAGSGDASRSTAGQRERTGENREAVEREGKAGWHIFAKRNVPTLRLREVALNVLPAGLRF